jgi:molecular chaperone GrpE
MKHHHHKKHEATPEPAADDASSAPAEGAREVPAGELDTDALVRERDEYLASWKRAAADYQNLRRRLQSDIDAAVARRKAALLGDLLLVLDYLDMALASKVETAEGKTLHAGVEATRAAMLGALEREGVRPLPSGGRFDPAVHACVATEDVADRDPGEILETLRPGYTLEGKILRPAQVRVAGSPGETDSSGKHGEDERKIAEES